MNKQGVMERISFLKREGEALRSIRSKGGRMQERPGGGISVVIKGQRIKFGQEEWERFVVNNVKG